MVDRDQPLFTLAEVIEALEAVDTFADSRGKAWREKEAEAFGLRSAVGIVVQHLYTAHPSLDFAQWADARGHTRAARGAAARGAERGPAPRHRGWQRSDHPESPGRGMAAALPAAVGRPRRDAEGRLMANQRPMYPRVRVRLHESGQSGPVQTALTDWVESSPGADPVFPDEFTTSIAEEVERFLVLHPMHDREALTGSLRRARQFLCSHQGRTTTVSAMDGEREYQVLVCAQCDAELDDMRDDA